MRQVRVIAVVLLSIGLVLASASVAGAADVHAVRGTVRGAAGEPIAGAAVDVYRAWGGDWVADAVSGPDGTYEVSGLADGTYDAAAQADGYLWRRPSTGPFVLATEPAAEGVDFTLDVAETISGMVVGTSGEPVPWARVRAYDSDGREVAESGADELGRFEIQGLALGAFRILADDGSGDFLSGWHDSKGTIDAADTVAAGASGVTIGLRAAGTARISGRLAGYAVPDDTQWAEAVAVDGSFARRVQAVDPGNGEPTFDIDRLPAGDYKVRAWSSVADVSYHGGPSEQEATTVHIDEATVAEGRDVELARGSGTVSGLVTDKAGARLVGEQVRLVLPDGRPVNGAATVTAQDGSYVISHVPAGSYLVEALDTTGELMDMYLSSRGGTRRRSEALVLRLERGGASSADGLTLPPRQGGLSGIVAAEDGNPLGGVQVTVHDGQGGVVATSIADANGTYVFGTLANGSYRVQAQDPAGRFEAGWAPDPATVIQGQSVNAEITMVASPLVATRASLSASRMRVRKGSLVVISGRLDPAFAAALVKLEGRDAYGRRFVVRRLTDSNGRMKVTVRIMKNMRFRVIYDGDSQHLASASRTLPVYIFGR